MEKLLTTIGVYELRLGTFRDRPFGAEQEVDRWPEWRVVNTETGKVRPFWTENEAREHFSRVTGR